MMSPETGVGADTVGGGGGDIVRRGEGERAGTTSVGSSTGRVALTSSGESIATLDRGSVESGESTTAGESCRI